MTDAVSPAPHAISLVVATLGRTAPLERLLRSLTRQTCADLELIVVDQNPPGTLEPILARFGAQLTIRHLRSDRGLSLARNVGLAAASAPLVAFPDDDCWYAAGVVAEVVSTFATVPDLRLLSGRTQDIEGRNSVSPFGTERCRVTRRNYLECGNSNSLFVRREVFEAIGGFDERLGVGARTPFQSGEEADVILRAIGAGYRMEFRPELVIFHDQVEADPVRTIKRSAAYSAGFGALLAKHRFGAGYLAYRVLRSAVRMVLTGLRSRDLARERAAWIAGMVRGYVGWRRYAAAV